MGETDPREHNVFSWVRETDKFEIFILPICTQFTKYTTPYNVLSLLTYHNKLTALFEETVLFIITVPHIFFTYTT